MTAPPADPTGFTAVELSRAVAARRVSCREVMAAYLDRVDRLNPGVNAIVSLRDRDDLLAEADARDDDLARGRSMGWMHGFPIAVKDLAETRGLRTTYGSPLFADFVPEEDALVAARMRASGAILIGKTNTPEFGLGSQTFNPVFGPTRNPYDRGRTVGGSSGGAAAALALRLLPVADGSDMGGSLRNPAAFANVVGFRPSRGRVPAAPEAEVFVRQLSTEGPMGRSVADAAALLAVLAGHDPRAPLSLDEDPAVFAAPLDSDVRGTRVGWLGDLGGHLPTEPGILDLGRDALRALEGLGCVVEEAELGFPPERLWSSWVTLRHWLIAGAQGALYADPTKRARLKPEMVWEIEGGLRLSAAEVYAASETRSAFHRAVLALFERHDAVVMPATQVFPFDVDTPWPKAIDGVRMDTYHRWMETVVPWTMAGCPAIGVPAGFGPRGLPTGVQIVGRPRADLAVLRLAHAYEGATRWTERRPPPEPATG